MAEVKAVNEHGIEVAKVRRLVEMAAELSDMYGDFGDISVHGLNIAAVIQGLQESGKEPKVEYLMDSVDAISKVVITIKTDSLMLYADVEKDIAPQAVEEIKIKGGK